MNKKLMVIVIVLSIVCLLAFTFLIFKKQSRPSQIQTISPNILYLTQPIHFFIGKVERISGNTVILSQTITTAPNSSPKSLEYQVVISQNTQISKPPQNISYLFKTSPSPSPLQRDISDIKVGQYAIVNTITDLRTLSGNEFEATVIQIPIFNVLSGKVVSVNDTNLTVRAIPTTNYPLPMSGPNSMSSSSQEKEYTVAVTPDTEISRYEQSLLIATNSADIKPPKPIKLSLSDLKPNMQIIIYTSEDISTADRFTALRIEPQFPSPTPLPGTSSSSVSPSAIVSIIPKTNP